MIKSINELVENAKKSITKTLVVACAADEHVLEAVEMARENNIINAILVGDELEIKNLLIKLNFDIRNYTYLNVIDKTEACLESVKIVSSNPLSFLMKGLVDTSVILKAALNKEFGLRTNNRISHVSVMEVDTYHKLIFMTDGAMNIRPTLDEKKQIIENCNQVVHCLGIANPKIGIIAAVEKVNPSMEATIHAEQLVKMNRNNQIKNCIIGGPFALDNAISKEAAMHKGVTDPIAGDVDVLIMPAIESGNVFYKTMMFLAGAKSASVIAGASKPIVLTSRADSKETKFYSIALGSLVINL